MPKVKSIYDKMPFGDYYGLPIHTVFHQDPGYLRWCMEEIDDFCIQEWEYLKDVTTRQKGFIPKEAKYEFGKKVYNGLIENFSEEEILAFMGGEFQETDPTLNSENAKKLAKFGLEPQPPKLFDRTYISIWWTSFPKLTGIWEFESYENTSKGLVLINLKPTPNSTTNWKLLNDRVGLIANFGPLALFKHQEMLNNYPTDLFQPGEHVGIESFNTLSRDEKYIISKL